MMKWMRFGPERRSAHRLRFIGNDPTQNQHVFSGKVCFRKRLKSFHSRKADAGNLERLPPGKFQQEDIVAGAIGFELVPRERVRALHDHLAGESLRIVAHLACTNITHTPMEKKMPP